MTNKTRLREESEEQEVAMQKKSHQKQKSIEINKEDHDQSCVDNISRFERKKRRRDIRFYRD
jgi:hypothetical protein